MEPHNHRQFVEGRRRLGQAVKLLLLRNDLSQRELDQLAEWAAPEGAQGSWLAKSQISTIINSKLPKPGPQIFLALASVNASLAAIASGKPHKTLPDGLRRLSAAPGPWFLAHPISGEPCDEGDWFRIYCGTLSIDELNQEGELFSDQTAIVASERLALLAQGWMAAERLNWRQGREEIAAMYKCENTEERQKLLNVLTGDQVFSGKDLDEWRERLRFLIGRLLTRDALSVREFDQWIRGSLRAG